MKQHVENVNQYLANLAVWNVKVHNLHFNVKGSQFMGLHKFFEGVYEEIFEYYDEVAEHLKMANVMPLVRMSDYLKVATIEEIEGRDYSCEESVAIILADMNLMKDMAVALRKEADEAGCFAGVSLMEEHIAYYAKQIWFLESTLG